MRSSVGCRVKNGALGEVPWDVRFERVTRRTAAGCTLTGVRRGVVTKRVAEATGRLLVVHWHPVVLKGLAAWISHVPQMELVGVASRCEQALDIAAELRPDLVLLGYSTPEMGGIEATRCLIAMHRDTRVVLIGVSAGPERKAKAIECGAMDYVLLDTPPWEIAATLRRLVKE